MLEGVRSREFRIDGLTDPPTKKNNKQKLNARRYFMEGAEKKHQ